ncbi:tetratricopeptide (TPR) repeat protein [Variovorax sp. 1140]|uniref:tetratricopeptide repeat protein n=1 Tax=Variovorax atrisoli TaxID=3394203 RepID=UPI0033957943
MTKQLPDDVFKELTLLCKEGDALVATSDFEAARGRFVAALRLLPEDHRQWEAATWIYVAIGDTHFRTKNFDKALKCFLNAVQCPQGLGNPYIHLRLGQIYFEQEYFDKAADELTRAYMGAGLKIFMEDDPKYLEFLETRIEI